MSRPARSGSPLERWPNLCPLVGYVLALIGAGTVVATVLILLGLAWSGIASHS